MESEFNVLHEAGTIITVEYENKYDGVWLFIKKGRARRLFWRTLVWKIKRNEFWKRKDFKFELAVLLMCIGGVVAIFLLALSRIEGN